MLKVPLVGDMPAFLSGAANERSQRLAHLSESERAARETLRVRIIATMKQHEA